VVLASATWSDVPLISLVRFATLIATACFALYFGIRYSFKMQLRLLGWAYGSAAILSAVFSLLFPGYSIGTGEFEGMWMGIYTDKNTLGRSMAIGFMVFLLLALCYPVKRWFFRGLAAFAVVLILLAHSATSLIECVVMCWAVPFFARLQPSDRPRRKFSLYFLASVGLLLVLAPVVFFDQVLAILGRDPGMSGRVMYWGLTTEFIAQRPWLGYGYYAFWRGVEGPLGEYWAAGAGNNSTDWLNVWLDLGIGGFVAFLVTIFYAVRRAFRHLRRSQRREDIWPLLFFSWLFIYSLSEAIFGSNAEMWMIFVTVATTLYVQETAGVWDEKFAIPSRAACAES
jgi:O-antigen ligase